MGRCGDCIRFWFRTCRSILPTQNTHLMMYISTWKINTRTMKKYEKSLKISTWYFTQARTILDDRATFPIDRTRQVYGYWSSIWTVNARTGFSCRWEGLVGLKHVWKTSVKQWQHQSQIVWTQVKILYIIYINSKSSQNLWYTDSRYKYR